jgi:hypothetical protein
VRFGPRPEGPSTSVASVTGESGAPIEVLVWTLDA